MLPIYPPGTGGGSTAEEYLYIGGRVILSPSACIILRTYFASGGAPAWSSFFLHSDTVGTGYTVTAGKTLQILAYDFMSTTLSSGSGYGIMYGDTAVGLNSAAAPTNPKYWGGSSNIANNAWQGTAQGADYLVQGVTYMEVPAGKCPHVRCDALIQGRMTIYCKEV